MQNRQTPKVPWPLYVREIFLGGSVEIPERGSEGSLWRIETFLIEDGEIPRPIERIQRHSGAPP